MNILITSAGRRVKIVQYFKRGLEKSNGKVITSDMDVNAPALYFSDHHYIVSEINSKTYIEELIEISRKHEIDAILSLIDPELEILIENESTFEKENIKLIASDIEMIQMSFDKFDAHNYFKQQELPTVPTFLDKKIVIEQIKTNGLKFPLIAKPRKGSASIGILTLNKMSDLKNIDNSSEEIIFQPYYKEKEYGVDVYIDMISGKLVDLFIKEKLIMRSGETDKSISIHNKDIETLVIELIEKTEFRGAIDIDIFEYKGKFYISEINPRFGGGYPHAYECGVEFPKYIMNNISGIQNKDYIGFNYEVGKVMMKYDDILIV